MKKIMSDKSFWIILIISIITLIGLTIGVIFLTRKNTKEFYSAGYIISSTATKTDKYYFDDNTVYKENVFNEFVFKDVDDNEVSTSKDNFIHYLDNSLSFMKNGVILDLDNFNDNIVPYYNITDKSIVQYNNGGYYIETADKTLVFGNFLGRITDNKYIVVGSDISVKLTGNDDTVKGDYFEILFIEDGIVKIENQEGSYQTISDGTIVYIGDNIKINLGDKSVNYGDEVKLNLSELTIDGNENIDIVPEEGLVDDKEEIDGSGIGSGTNDDNIDDDGNGTGNDTETEDGVENDAEGETTTILKKEVAVNLIEASSTVNSINAKFQVIDTMEAIKGNLVLTLVNTDTGKTIYTKVLANTPEEQPVYVTSLNSDSNYVMTIVDETNEISTQYFQKAFRTNSLNLKLKRELVTETSLSYSLDFGTQSDVARADISIYTEDGEFIGRQTVEKDSNIGVTFDDLTNNTLYVVKVDNVYIKNVLEESYSSTTSDLTLKKKPVLGSVSVGTNTDAKMFTLKMDSDSIIDDDNSIVKYTYQIFESIKDADDTEKLELVYSFAREDINEEILKIGQKIDGEKELESNTDYKFKIVAQYYDNYRYNEIESGLSEDFNVVGLPTIRFEPDEITINTISGTVIIEDEGCAISFEGRKCSNAPNNLYIQYYDGTTMIRNNVEINDEEDITIDEKLNELALKFEVTGLQQNTPHIFDVYADVDLNNGEGVKKDKHLGSFTIWTDGIDSLKIQKWKDNDYSFENPISVSAEMVSNLAENDSINTLRSLTFNLYGGDARNYIGKTAVPIASYTVTGNIKEQFYNEESKVVLFNIDSSMFEYGEKEKFKISDLNVLKELSGGNLYEKYTIEITGAKDEGGANEFIVTNNVYVYNTPSMLLLEDKITTDIIVEEITNAMTESGKYGVSYINDKNVDSDLIRGYTVTADFDDQKIKDIVGTNSISKINFYAYNKDGRIVEQKTIDFNETGKKTVDFYLGDGTDYYVKDVDLRRGNSYTFAFDLSIDDDGDPNTAELTYPSNKHASDVYEAEKQVPKIRYYIDNSTDTSITFKYQVFDYDKALHSEDDKYYIYYNINGSDDYKVEYVNDYSVGTFTLSNLTNGSIYNFGYYSAVSKQYEPERNDVGSYYFDGLYNLEDELQYTLDYNDDSNYLNIILSDNEFTNRVSSYLLVLTANGVEQKYQKVISNLSKCDDKQCIILNYKDLKVKNSDGEISFKGKNVTVELIAFYDTGYIGFSQETKLGNYFKDLGLVSDEDASKVGFVYQTNSVNEPGKYFYVTSGKYVLDKSSNIQLYDYPRGILGFELDNKNFNGAIWYINSSNLIDEVNSSFTSFGKITHNNSGVELDYSLGGIVVRDAGLPKNSTPVTINPKVLDKVEVNPTKDNTFKFTSIIPNISANVNDRLINGVTMDITLNVDDELLKSDYCATDEDNLDSDVCGHKGKYNIYINIYQKDICPETGKYADKFKDGTCVPGELYDKYVKTEVTDVNNLTDVSFIGLLPDTEYTYTLSADMNKNGKKVETLLFDENGDIFEGKFSTLNKDEIFTNVSYSHSSTITDKSYSTRKLNLNTDLKNKTNFNLVYELFDVNGEAEFGDEGVTISNDSIVQYGNKFTASYVHDITGNDFVFGSNYYELVITAITTDVGAPLELYRNKLTYNTGNYGFRKLDSFANSNVNGDFFTIGLEHVAGVNDITSTIKLKDVDKVIKDGKFYVRLQDTNEKNLLSCKDNDAECKQACESIYNTDQEEEALVNACRLTVNIDVNDAGKIAATCENMDKYTNVESCDLVSANDNEYAIKVKFKDLKADNFYSIFVHADTYSKNYENGSLTEPDGVVTARKNQYTKSSLGFSLGSVTPTYSLTNNKLTITYVDSANLTDSLYGMEYTITERGGSKVMNGVLGDTVIDKIVTKNNLSFTSSSNPRVDIPLDGKTLSKNTTYYITITYYYKDSDGNLKLLQFGDKTNQVYTIEVS